MDKPEFFEQVDKRGYYRPVGEVTFELAVSMVADAMIYSRENGITELLANVRGLRAPYSTLTVFDRYQMAVRWADSAGTELRVVLVTRPEMMDPDKIGLLMAQNRGVTGEVFTDEAEALAWLDRIAP
jgi:hypothetical protein